MIIEMGILGLIACGIKLCFDNIENRRLADRRFAQDLKYYGEFK